jgi:hypothetical protein
MATGRPTGKNHEADERAVRSFLEKAAPIILESRVLDGKRFEAVCALADQLGLTRDQLACELRLLEQRGVIASAPWDQLDDFAGSAQDDAAASTKSSPAPAATRGTRGQAKIPTAPAAQPPGMPPPPDAIEISTSAMAIHALRDRALKILARRGALTPRTRRKLEKAGKHAGLSKSQIAAVLDALTVPDAEHAPAAETTAPTAAPRPTGRARQRPEFSPSESFRRWIQQKISDYASSMLATEDEKGLIGVGVHRYHLAEVLATHVVRDVTTERGIRLERDLDGASCNSTVGTSVQASADDERLQAFFEEVAPILTQHRGINAKSRVMMNAVAERLGLSEQELELALATLQRRAHDPDEDDPRQLERRESFRAYLRRTMAQLPNGIITFKTEWRLSQAGEHFHGVAPKWIKSTIKEVAAEIGARFISKQQAVEHITQLVEDQLSGRPVIDGTTRARIYKEGTRWGLDPMDVDTILRERTETLRRQLAVERRRSRRVINFVIAGLAVAGTILAAMFLMRPLSSVPEPTENPARTSQKPPPPQQLVGLPWWDERLRVAQARVRVMRPDLRPTLDKITAERPSERGAAYEQLVEQYTAKLPLRRKQRQDGQQLFASLYTLDPSDTAARALTTALLAGATSLQDGLPAEPQSIEIMMWGCQVAVAMLKDPDTSLLRRNSLAEQLESATQVRRDPLLDAEALERFFGATLVKRLYQLLKREAEVDADRASQFYGTVATFAQRYVDASEGDRLDVEFLSSILPAVGQRWDRYGDAIQRVSTSSDTNTIIKLLDVFRRATDDRLRNYIAGLFFDRLGAAPGTLTESEMIQEVRESIGVASKERLLRRWKQLDELVQDLLSRKHVERTNPDVLLQETIELAHAATLACALTRGESAGPAFDELYAEGPTKLSLAGGPWPSALPDKYDSTYPVPRTTVLQTNITNLITARSPDQRISLLSMIANQTESVSDIDLASGQTLAEYLARFKTVQSEHTGALSHVARLSRWKAVRIGLADQVLDVTGRDAQLQELLAQVIGRDVDLTTKRQRDEVRRELLGSVLEGLSDTPLTDDPRYLVFDEASRALAALYARQAELLGVPAELDESAQLPSAAVAALISHFAERLGEGPLDPEDKSLVESLPYRSKAIDYVADNDLQYTAAQQQIWLRLLAIWVVQQRSENAQAVRQILDESQHAAEPQQRVFEQLRDVQTDLLQIWMQLRPSFTDSEYEALDV